MITKNGKLKFERRYYKNNVTKENVCLTDKILSIDKGERIDKKVKAKVIEKASDQSYHKSGKLVVLDTQISATIVMRNVKKWVENGYWGDVKIDFCHFTCCA